MAPLKKSLFILACACMPFLAVAEDPNGGNNGTLMDWSDVNGGNGTGSGTNTTGTNTTGTNGTGTGTGSGTSNMTTSSSSNTWGWFCYYFPQYCGGNDVPLDGGLSIVAAAGAGIAARRVYVKRKGNKADKA